MFGTVCGVVVVCLLTCVVCVVFVLRRTCTTAKPSYLKPSSDPAGTTHPDTDASSTPMSVATDNCVTAAGHHNADWNVEYTNMINVRITLANVFYLFSYTVITVYEPALRAATGLHGVTLWVCLSVCAILACTIYCVSKSVPLDV